ncbi:O-antigen polymerase involved in exopolysaccharide biosynthesis [Desulforapulum autotrophicum HRM2]|uniref:O-antigen polymerase involved in exopolysaccharide biosynthesis n=1 Tax=Desulforapulum autotrophicum (strain ATCC 43914 / DSM 3382 / VKM B-1955 / HRM2) TaxID=177437 RepID=C0QH03_DESAH|nr:O-antigen ligase family protein [Desulforapulum autotrophicum]ACN15652.1 O-antigen polymerase involved in exopolysaccharide biosynthesis [Desulforapulum autotrophicum HRM2]
MKLVNYIFYFLIIACPLAFGTVHPWSIALMEILCFSALFLCLTNIVQKGRAFHLPPGSLPFFLFMTFMLFQVIPLPVQLVKSLSPAAFQVHQNTDVFSGPARFMTLSIHPGATIGEFFRYLSYWAFYVLTVQLLTNKTRLKRTIIVITIFGGLLSFSSILQFYLTKDMALWFWHVPVNSMIVGPYICHNHYAGLMEMIFPVVLALFFFYRPRMANTTLLQGVIQILSQEKANIHLIIGGAALLIVTSVFVSLSRGGMISLCLSLVFFTFLLFRRKISRGNTLLIIAVIVVAALSIAWFGWDQIFDRFSKLKNAQGVIHESRFDFWQDSLGIIRDFFWVGSGFGTYIDIFPAYQTVYGALTINHAHNDYIEMVVEGGLVGFLLAAAFIVTLFSKTYSRFMQRKDAYCVYIYMGSITGLVAFLFHGFTDFNLHIAANGLWFFFMAGLAVSAANTKIKTPAISTLLVPVKSPVFKKAVIGLTMVALAGGGVYKLSVLTGYYYFSHIRKMTIAATTPVDTLEKIEKIAGIAIKFDPLNADYHFAVANAAMYLNQAPTALENFKQAVALNPASSTYLKRLGLFFQMTGNAEQAGSLLKASVTYDISDPDNALEYGAWLLSRDRVGQGTVYVRRAIELDPKMIDKALTTMAVLGLNDEEMATGVPKMPGPYIVWANFLYGNGKIALAEQKYLETLDYIEKQKKISAWDFYRVCRFFQKQGKTETALKVMQRAVQVLPLDAGIRISLGDIYRKMGVTYRADEEYEQALLIDPGNKKAKQRLKR